MIERHRQNALAGPIRFMYETFFYERFKYYMHICIYIFCIFIIIIMHYIVCILGIVCAVLFVYTYILIGI